MDDFGAGFIFSSLIWFVSVSLIGTWSDSVPVELPFYEHCEKFESTLKSYDGVSFACENGANFKRSITEEK